MSDKGKGIADDDSSGKRKRDRDDKSGNRKRKNLLKVDESESSDDDVSVNDESEEIVEKEEVDRISELPNGLIAEILSRLPSTNEAIRSGTLSKRWNKLWTSVSTLMLEHVDWKSSLSDFYSCVDNILNQRGELKLKKLAVKIIYDTPFESQVNNLIRYAIKCNAEELSLDLLETKWKVELWYQPDQIVYVNSVFTDLSFKHCKINPAGAINWNNLRSLYLKEQSLDKVLFEKILSGSPVLETLVLHDCYGFKLLNITSKSLRKLVLLGYTIPYADYLHDTLNDVVRVNAPYLLSLKIRGRLALWKLLLLNVSSVVEASLNYVKRGEETIQEGKEEMLERFIKKLSHVKVLKIGVCLVEVMSLLKRRGFNFPSNIKITTDDDLKRMKEEDFNRAELDDWSDSYFSD